MSESLTDEQLREMEDYEDIDIRARAARAAAEIRELRAENGNPLLSQVAAAKIRELRADNAGLRVSLGQFGCHHEACAAALKLYPGTECGCGLDAALSKKEENGI